ncbi:hypothetical protein [Spirosoma luteum]|uniref:hypothetical protein n=1 Tax=Spirosoma luteum TaxID=431553 RepID=UPI00035E2307|nr:hypothetical protein [Spirosoma luteum]
MTDDFIRVFEDESSGGYVDVHEQHNGPERSLNVETAIVLAQFGYQLLLLPVIDEPGVKNPDAFLVNEKKLIEFKHNTTPTPSAIDNEIRDAHRQAETVLIHIQSTIKAGNLLNGVKGRVRRSQNIKAIWLIWQSRLFIFSREQVFDGTIDHKIQ